MDFAEKINALIILAKEKAAGGLTLRKIGLLFTEFQAAAVAIAADFANPGVEKKAWVMKAVGQLYDAVAPAVPLPMIFQPFRRFVSPIIRRIVLGLADGAIEAIYAQFKENNPEGGVDDANIIEDFGV